jgi:hypothetical protein
VTDAVYERFHDKFEALVKNEIEIWLRFHEYWLHECSRFQCSCVTFEDLIQDANQELVHIFKFAFGQSQGRAARLLEA